MVELGDKVEEGWVYSNLGSVFYYKRDFDKVI